MEEERRAHAEDESDCMDIRDTRVLAAVLPGEDTYVGVGVDRVVADMAHDIHRKRRAEGGGVAESVRNRTEPVEGIEFEAGTLPEGTFHNYIGVAVVEDNPSFHTEDVGVDNSDTLEVEADTAAWDYIRNSYSQNHEVEPRF